MKAQQNTARRGFLKAILGTTALALPTTARAEVDTDLRRKVFKIVQDLENIPDWESSVVAGTKHYASAQMREALGMEALIDNHVDWYTQYREKRIKQFLGGTG